MEPPKGYWNLYQAAKCAQLAAEAARDAVGEAVCAYGAKTARETIAGSAFLNAAALFNRAPADILREALGCGELLAAGVREQDGALVTMPVAAWRRRFARTDDPWRMVGRDDHSGREKYGPPAADRVAFSEAMEGRSVPFDTAGDGTPTGWATPIIAQADLARWMGEEPPAEPVERPNDWLTKHDTQRRATEEQLEWFLMGYAVRALESGKAATRDEARDAVVRENVAPARLAEKVHAGLPARLKNPDRSKGGNRPK